MAEDSIVKSPDETQRCMKCGKTMSVKRFYRYRNGKPLEICKACLTMHMDCFEPESFLWALKKCDVPYIPSQWNTIRDRYFEKDPDNINTTAVFGKYLATMHLKKWMVYGWDDTEKLLDELNEKQQQTEEEKRQLEEFNQKLKEQRDQGEISEAEYLTYASIESRKEERETAPPPTLAEAIGEDNYYKEENYLDLSELPNPAEGLTKEDQIWLVMKWGNAYNPSQLLALEKKYNEMKRDFSIKDSDTEGTLILLCKTYLKMNESIDVSDFESYQKLSKSYDTLRKSSCFTAAQKKKEEDKGFVDCIGNLVKYCEKMKGQIPRYDLSVDRDIFDKEIRDMKDYTKNLIYQDKSLARQIEEYLKRKEIQEKRKAAEKEAEQKGLDLRDIPLTEEDYLASLEQTYEQASQDEINSLGTKNK